MNIEEYREWTRTTALYPKDNSKDYLILGLVSEAGEVAGKRKKIHRGDYTEEEVRAKMLDELSDVLWYMARILDEEGVSFEELADINKAKLEDRAVRGVIKGSGDDR